MVRVAGVVSVVLLLAGCGGPLTGRFRGDLAVTQGVCAADAHVGDRAPATLMLRDGEAIFLPGDGVVELHGHVDPNGQVSTSSVSTGTGSMGTSSTGASKGASATPKSAADRFTQVFEGSVKDGHVTGHYASPRCRADVTLEKRS